MHTLSLASLDIMITALGASFEVARWLHEYITSWDELILGRVDGIGRESEDRSRHLGAME
jgi:hypothetical protein